MPISGTSLTAEARTLARAGRREEAAAIVSALLHERFGLDAHQVQINVDIYGLNSLNGTFEAAGQRLYFKFHQEENEEAMAGEYYRAGLLAEAALPVDQPLHVSTEPGQQILVYRRRDDLRFADVLSKIDFSNDTAAARRALAAERRLNEELIRVYRKTLHRINAAQSAAEPIHRLFHERLVDPIRPNELAGRFASFYRDQVFAFPGLTLAWSALKHLTFEINDIVYRDSLGTLFDEAFRRLAPANFAGSGGVTAHGDAHNANIWYEDGDAGPRLVMFDPAFAGSHVPALLAEVKTTFHNIFAHPLWLYDSKAAFERFQASARLVGDRLQVTTDWQPSEIRRELLALKRDIVWRPLLSELAGAGLLPADWRRMVRLGLFLCPTLVMNLRVGGGLHNPVSSLIGFAVAVAMGSEPTAGDDEVSRFLDSITP
jgi:hypothetical protein